MIGAARYRTHSAVGAADTVGQQARVAGWVHRRRDHGGVIFIDLRDRSGILQLVFHPDTAPEAHASAERLHLEDVISVAGTVMDRSAGTVNPRIPTGSVELAVAQIERLAETEPVPFSVEDETTEPSEELRLTYRYIDMRRPRRLAALELRARVARAMRRVLDDEGFLEVETPVLTRSTPEGARDFLVPSRLSQGDWYALPQSPQLFKQLLMVGGIERYYQIARCFRDEDLRADRQPEFTQLDIEASFVEPKDIEDLTERVLVACFAEAGIEIPTPFPRMGYAEAMRRFGTDRPDLRFGIEIQDWTEAAGKTDFAVFKSVVDGGGVVRGLVMPGAGAGVSRKDGDGLMAEAQALGAKGLVWAIVQFYLYLAILTFPFRSIGMLITNAQRASASGQRVFEILDTEPEIAEARSPVSLPEGGGGAVRIEGVTFGYDADRPVLHDVSLDIPAGRVVAIIGATGSGKSTLTQLIPRYYDPQQGTITLDGVDVRDAPLDDVRRAVGMVGQDPFLFSDTVRENIAFGQPDATDDQVHVAARQAQADTFIRALPEGYDTVVGERGFTLSGGQRQRIAIARAFLMDPRVLVLDEATASVDASTEREISRALKQVMQGRTTIIIAHRLSTISLADEIVLIADGHVAARGTHDALLASSALYREIYDQGLARPDELVARDI